MPILLETLMNLCRCKSYQGGATAHTANIRFWNPNSAPVAMSDWSWGHQVRLLAAFLQAFKLKLAS